jgi:hypothetical protein
MRALSADRRVHAHRLGQLRGRNVIPPQTQVSDTFYSYPGINAFGPYPGAGYASICGVGFTPCGYTPYGGFTYL